MKKKFTKLLFGLLCISSSIFGQVPTNGLVAYYPFNGNTNDESGNGNHGINHGAALIADRFGNANSAYSFDGTTDIELPAANLKLSEYTYSFWAQVSPIPQVGGIYIAMSIGGDGGDQQIACLNQYGATKKYGWSADSYYGPGLQYLTFQQSALIESKWSLVTVTRDVNSSKLYYDGNLVATDRTVDNTTPYYGTSNLKAYIGKRYNSTLPFKGVIDDVRIYNRALSDTEVKAIYDGGQQVDLSSGLVAYYPFNGNANDESGNGNNGINHGTTLTADRFGKANRAYSFGDISQYILCPDVFDYKNRSISVWFNATESTSTQLIYCYDHTGLKYGFDQLELQNNNGVAQLIYKTCDGVQRLPVDVTLNKWHHAVTVFFDNVTKFYLDGILVGQFNYNQYYFSSAGQSSSFVIGSSRMLENGTDQHFIGSIDDVKIYNRALIDSEVQLLYDDRPVNLASGLVAYYPFNGNTNDESGNGNNGTNNGATPTTDRFGKANSAYSFDGVSNYIQVDDALKLNNENYTYSFWVKEKKLKPCSFVMEVGYKELWSSQSFGINHNYLSPISAWSVSSANTDGSRFNFHAGDAPSSDTWYHIVMLRSDTSVNIYQNGKLLSSQPTNGLLPFYNSPLSIYIGTRANWATNTSGYNFFLDGDIDDIRIYNRALNVNEIQALSVDGSAYQIEVGDAIAHIGDTIEVSVTSKTALIGDDNIISYQFNLAYDSTKLQYVDNSLIGTIAEGGAVSVNMIKRGNIKTSYMTSTPVLGAGDILKLKFKALAVDTTLVSVSNFYFNTQLTTDIKNSSVIIVDTVAPKANIKFSQTNGQARYGDDFLITATFTEPMLSNPLPQISFSGAVNLIPSDMTRVNDTVFTYQYSVPKANGTVLITLGAGKDLDGNNLVSKPVTGKEFIILPLVYGDVDNNGKIMAYDAALILQYSVGINPVKIPLSWSKWRIATANVDEVGDVTANDAALVLKHSTNIISSFPVEGSLKSTTVNNADVNVVVENNELVFRSTGSLFGLNVFIDDKNQTLGRPKILNDSMISAFVITNTQYAVGLATAFSPRENSVFMKIPIKSATNLGNLSIQMIINTESVTKSVSTTTSLNDKKVVGISVYPNPVTEVLNINMPSELNNVVVSVYSVDGRLVLVQQMKSTESAIRVSALSKGFYTVVLSSNGTTYKQKFIKE